MLYAGARRMSSVTAFEKSILTICLKEAGRAYFLVLVLVACPASVSLCLLSNWKLLLGETFAETAFFDCLPRCVPKLALGLASLFFLEFRTTEGGKFWII